MILLILILCIFLLIFWNSSKSKSKFKFKSKGKDKKSKVEHSKSKHSVTFKLESTNEPVKIAHEPVKIAHEPAHTEFEEINSMELDKIASDEYEDTSLVKSSVEYVVTLESICLIQPSLPFRVYEFPLLFSKQECSNFIMYARPFLEKSKIHTLISPSSVLSKRRTSSSCVIRHNAITDKIKTIAETLTGFPIGHMENTQVVQYKQGQMFDFHYDTSSEKTIPAWSRVATVMVYLNDNFEGGETEFKHIKARIRPEQGKVVLFWSALDGNIIPESLHRGNKITKGTKWLVNQWVHFIPLNFVS